MLNTQLTKEISLLAHESRLHVSPHPLLSNYISHYAFYCASLSESHKAAPSYLEIVPDASGCLVFVCHGQRVESTLWGPTTKIKKVKNDVAKGTIYFFIEFLPGGNFAFTGLDQYELTDRVFPLELVHATLVNQLCTWLQSETSLRSFLTKVDTFMLAYLQTQLSNQSLLWDCLKKIHSTYGKISVRDLATSEHISERQLRRVFQQSIGVNVKQFMRITKINYALSYLQASKSAPFSKMATNLGYYDEPHMIKHFVEILGVSPKQYAENMSVFYNESDKYSSILNV